MTPSEFRSLRTIFAHHFSLTTYKTLASMGGGEAGDGTEAIDLFSPPSNFSWTEWFDLAQDCGAQAAILTAKHVDGLTMWNSSTSFVADANRSLRDTAWYNLYGRRDLFGEFCTMARARGMKVGVYYCVLDNWLKLQLGGLFSAPDYTLYTQAQLNELFRNYGTLDFCCLDGWGSFWNGVGPTFTDIPVATLKGYIQAIQPGCLCMINNHESSQGFASPGDIALYEGTVDGEPPSNLDVAGLVRTLWRPVRRGSLSQLYGEWFTHTDSIAEAVEPAVRNGAYTRSRMAYRNWPNIVNTCYGPTGVIMPAEKEIVRGIFQAQIPTVMPAPAAHFKFDEVSVSWAVDHVGLNDLTGQANPGRTIGTRGGRRTFNGTTQWFYGPVAVNSHDFEVGARSASFAVVVRTPASYGSATVIFAKDLGTDGGLNYLLESQADGKVIWRASPDGSLANKVDLNNGSALSTSATHLIVAVYDRPNALLKLSVDGGAFVTAAYTGGSIKVHPFFGVPFKVGARGLGTEANEPFAGGVEELSYWQDYVLTTTDVAYLWNSGRFRAPEYYVSSTRDVLNDLVLRYKMDALNALGKIPDFSLNGFDGTIAGTYAFVSTPRGNGVDFQAANATIQHTATSVLLNSTPISVFCWAKVRTVPGFATYICKNKASSPWNGWYLRDISGVSATVTVGGVDYTANAPGGSLTAGTWAHIGFTYDGETLICYRDGVAGTANTSPSGIIDGDSANLVIGNDLAAPTRNCDGVLDDVRIYNRALSASEIKRVMRNSVRPSNSMVQGIALVGV
jgi:hypothetical protein